MRYEVRIYDRSYVNDEYVELEIKRREDMLRLVEILSEAEKPVKVTGKKDVDE